MSGKRVFLLAALTALVVGGTAGYLLSREDSQPPPDAVAVLPGGPDPFAYSEDRREEFERRAARGHAHVVYAKSPGGVVRSAERTARFRADVERVAPRAGVDADTLEAIVLLESAGRPAAAADPRLEGAVGLTQILAETGRNLLAMEIDTVASRRLTRQIGRAERRGQEARARRLRARRARVDERFDPRKALEATARYLEFARGRLGEQDLAVASYHMGVGNLEGVITAFGDASPSSYAKLFFGSAPGTRPAAYGRLASLGDDSSTYFWRVLASREIMRLFREDPGELERIADLQTAKASAEEVLHPEEATERFADPEELEDAYSDGLVRSFPNAPRRTGLRRDRRMGELARRLEREPRLYRGLRPEAYALALYIARIVRASGGGAAPLTVTSTVRDQRYQDLLLKRNREATRAYSLHVTGYAFDISRAYASRAQARALQFALDRLQSLDLIAWAREPAAIHVTAAREGRRLIPLLRSGG